MARKVKEIQEQQSVVQSVGDFAGSLQQIAAARMVKLRKMVLDSRRFVDEATIILRELHHEKKKRLAAEKKEGKGKKKKDEKEPPKHEQAIIVVSSDQGLAGSYNVEIIKKLEEIIPENLSADYYVIGKKGQEYFKKASKKHGVRYYPYNIPEEVGIDHLKPLIGMFYYYDQINMVYSKYINTTTRDVIFIELAVPAIEEVDLKEEEEEGKFIFEPDIDELIIATTAKLRYALFRQQILDSRLSLYTAQMIAMQTASENAQDLLKELQMEYNKARRKQIDKKIQEVQAGRALWDTEK